MSTSETDSAYERWDYSMDEAIETVWTWFEKVLIPIVVAVGLVGNSLCLLVWSRRSCGVPRTARFYYLLIAALDFGPLLTYHLLFSFIGVQMAETFHMKIMSNVYCSVTNWLWYSSELSVNLIYVFFSVERVYVISAPLKALGVFTLRKAVTMASVWIAYCFGINVICLLTYQLVTLPNGSFDCQTDLSSLSLVIQYHYVFCELAITSANALANVILVAEIVTQSRKRGKLTSGAESAVSSREIATSVTVIAMVSIHVVLFIPDAVCWVAFFAMKTTGLIDSDPPFAYSFLYVGLITTSATGVAHCLNFFVYFTRIPAFRKALCA